MLKTIYLCIYITLFACPLAAIASQGHEITHSDIKSDETVVFFRTTAWLDEQNQEWHVPIHGWIYEPEDSTVRVKLISSILKNKYDLTPSAETDANFSRRINLLIADNERGKHIVVFVAGRTYVLPESRPNGHFEKILTIPVTEIEKFAENNLVQYKAITRKSETRTFPGEVRLVNPTGLSIISDLDDTVKVSNVTDRRSLLEHTFLLDFTAAPSMAELYNRWSRHDVSLHFVSSSPWQLYSPLKEFLDESSFPWSSFSLKAVRFRDKTLFDLFKKGTETKPVTIERILSAYGDRKFVLVGDSGEQDPEVYAAILQKHPDQILKIFIRNVTQESADNERFKSVFAGIDAQCWQLFDDPLTLVLPQYAY